MLEVGVLRLLGLRTVLLGLELGVLVGQTKSVAKQIRRAPFQRWETRDPVRMDPILILGRGSPASLRWTPGLDPQVES